MSKDIVAWDTFDRDALEQYRAETIEMLEFYHDRLLRLEQAIREKS